jgi:hypothetical protein
MLDFHRELLADEGRTLAFRDAIRSVVTPDSVVLDLGCGSGILAFFACQAGARRVFAVEKEHDADVAALLSRSLGFADRLEVIHARSTEIELPEKATVLVTETLGALGLEERIVSSVRDARKRLLAPEAAIIPGRVEVCIAAAELTDLYEQHVGFWSSSRYGFDLSAVRLFASNGIHFARATADAFLAPPAPAIDVDLSIVAESTVSGTARSTATRRGVVHGFIGWFVSALTPSISISNETAGTTHWPQAFLPLESPIAVEEGTPIETTIETQDGKWWRWRGSIGSQTFDQTTWFSMPPCRRDRVISA